MVAAAVALLGAVARADLQLFAGVARGSGSMQLLHGALTGSPSLRSASGFQSGSNAKRLRQLGSIAMPASRRLGSARQAFDVATEPLTADVEVEEDGAPWLILGSEIDIAGVSAANAYAVYAHLPNHRQWSSLLTEVLSDGSESEWSLDALGVHLAWRAKITEEVAPARIAWESVDGIRNRGWATFTDVAAADGGDGPACKVRLQLAFQTPWPLERVFTHGRLSIIAEQILKQDLARFADVVTHGGTGKAHEARQAEVIGPLTRSTYSDGIGSCSATLGPYGDIEVLVTGFGTSGNTQRMLEDLAHAMEELAGMDIDQVDFRALIDMTRGLGCSPLAFPIIVRFLRGSGRLIDKTAVLGPMPLMKIAQAITMMARQKGVGFFSSRQEATDWLALSRKGEAGGALAA